MKRFFYVLLPVVAAFTFFSFLSHKDLKSQGSITIFFDRDMDHCSAVMRDVESKMTGAGYDVRAGFFKPAEIDHFIMSNPSALYVTDRQVKSGLFSLRRLEYTSARVAVTSRRSDLSSISGRELLQADARGEGADASFPGSSDDVDVLRRVMKNRMSFGVISFPNLSLQVKPLSVDGVFPSVANIRNGSYPYVHKAFIYHQQNDFFEESDSFETLFGARQSDAFTVIAGGDVMLGRGTGVLIRRLGPDYPFQEIMQEVQKHDVAFANLESPISDRGTMFAPFKGIYFRAEPVVVAGLQSCGFSVLSLANNHVLDWGVESILDTMRYLEKGGIKYSGVGRSREQALEPAVFTISGVRVAFICFNDIYPFSVREAGGTMQTLSMKGNTLKEEINDLRKRFDVVIASVHAGTEYLPEPEREKREKMRSLVDAGVQVVLGSHPHVIQEIEVYGSGLIAYSLGNLIFDQGWSRETSLGMLLEIGFLGNRPLYYKPNIVSIERSRARIIDLEDADSVLSFFSLREGKR
jgi:poly-gamma-glutamate capsule biosynthesis protein CapA/YwtB (metallophosphatase superfamily)